MYVNKFMFCGHLVNDPVLFDYNGSPGARFVVALNKPRSDRAIYIKCVAWRDQASVIAQYCRKGQEIHVGGEVDINSYVDSEGVTRKDFSVTVKEFSMGRIPNETVREVEIPKPRIPLELKEELS